MQPLWQQILNKNPISMAGEAVAPLWQKILQPRQSQSTQPAQPTQSAQIPLWKKILGEPFQGAESIVPLAQKARALTRQYIDQPFERLTQPIEQSYMQKFNVSPEQMAQIKPKAELAITSVMGETTPLKFLKSNLVSKLSKVDDLKPLIQEAKKYKSAEEFVKAQFKKKPEYGMGHRPTYEGMPPSHNLLEGETLPKDVYTHPDFSISSGRIRAGDKAANESWAVLQKIKDNPEAEVILYRAGAKNELNTGDWVTFSKDYAKQSLEGTEKVYSFKAKAKDVIFAGDDINEFGYYPKSQLTDIWKEANQGGGIKSLQAKPLTQSIAQEARKYKSAEEFVKNDFQQKVIAGQDLGKEIGKKVNPDGTITIYHGTSKQNAENIFKNGSFNESSYFSVKKSGTEYGDSPLDVAKRKFGKDAVVLEIKVDARELESAAAGSEVFSPQKLIKGKDGIWRTEGIKEKSELISIWKEANK